VKLTGLILQLGSAPLENVYRCIEVGIILNATLLANDSAFCSLNLATALITEVRQLRFLSKSIAIGLIFFILLQ